MATVGDMRRCDEGYLEWLMIQCSGWDANTAMEASNTIADNKRGTIDALVVQEEVPVNVDFRTPLAAPA